MFKLMFLSIVLLLSVSVRGADETREAVSDTQKVVDLRDQQALAALQRTRPDHYAKIRNVLEALRAQPQLAEGNWLQVNVNASDVDLSRYILRTSYPPRQLLRFTLDDTRYVMHLVRSDMSAEVTRAQ